MVEDDLSVASLVTYFRPFLHRQIALDGLQEDDTGLRRMETVGGALWQQRLMPSRRLDSSHFPSAGLAFHFDGALLVGGDHGLAVIQFHQIDFHYSVEYDRKFIMSGRIPIGGAFGAKHLQHITQIECHYDLFIRLGLRGDIENVREGVILGVVIDDFQITFHEIGQRAEYCMKFTVAHAYDSSEPITQLLFLSGLSRRDTVDFASPGAVYCRTFLEERQ